MIHLDFPKKNLSPNLGPSDLDPVLRFMAIAVEPKEGVEEGGHTAEWVITEVVHATGWVVPLGAPDLGPTPRLGVVAITA
jgi:hypothetical protein